MKKIKVISEEKYFKIPVINKLKKVPDETKKLYRTGTKKEDILANLDIYLQKNN